MKNRNRSTRLPPTRNRPSHLFFLSTLLSLLHACNSFTTCRHLPSSLNPLIATRDSTTASTPPLYSTTSPINKKKTASSLPSIVTWAPTDPTEALNEPYHTIVRAAHLRHILLHTSPMADLTLRSLSSSSKNNSTVADPFGELARSLSLCDATKEDGGRIGWVDNPHHPSFRRNNNGDDDDASSRATADAAFLDEKTVAQIFSRRPKGGDTVITSSPRGWHVVRVDDVLTDFPAVNNRRNKVRRKLPGSGVTPSPSGDPRTYSLVTTGCQMNVADSERMEGVLKGRFGLEKVEEKRGADVVVINTCTIRDHAEQKLYDLIGPIAARKRRGESVSLIVTGCVAQQEGEALLTRCPEIDMVMGPQYVNRMGPLLEDVQRGYQIVATDPTLISEEQDGRLPVRGSDVRAFVNVIFGCNERCTYCVVPTVRGVEQSRPKEFILEEIRDLEDAGYKEVTLIGQNIDAYGRDMTPRCTFAELLTYLNDNLSPNKMERIRYVTSHPRYFSDNVIDAVANLDKVCECFHMPFQSGDDGVLKAMRRGYTYNSYMKIINKIRNRAPDASITADVIVGFPGETEQAFQRTLDLMEEVKFDNINSFAYSRRPNTEAAHWEDQIPEHVKAERLQMVQRLAVKHALERSERYLGTVQEVLVEEVNAKRDNQVMGRTRQGRQVFFDGIIDDLKGKLVMVEILEARPWSLTGRMVEDVVNL